ncbi:isocitrate lyase/phosphoenolpyruvate mutase family protein [Pasteurella skyensis]|uniref:Isocitrate lyase/phosphoenolpyruvate mutase family protein n=1 Tax=Phocoenobacter skyensis TaxID=97481 RepID=A0AAJ6NDB3_9PAST|nr:isocitrate lyase/phosphoenolpyruvate mutase family protein [Pasteurella skyensis]MDP8171232.1 isocitrate lyase/phosphoenolpyruvate mutase family protein [Pasteurella skyensis]MDP8174680.1 isocitrate lyase/phosphoenolpyruvate mutase family protein [Pasteurella skyensis]
MRFKELHNQTKPLLIANVWDVPSAKIAEKQNFQAIGTSSAAIATLLGYDDGEKISFSELEYVVKRIISNTKLPLSVDLEAGYSRNPATIVNHIKKLAQLGVVGINIEDSVVINDIRTLVNADDFAKTLKEITEHLKKENINIFINVRIDTFLLGVPNVIEETKKRIKLYEKTHIDGLFLPCIEKEMDIKEVVNYTKLPINVMCMPNLPDFKTLHHLGVKRISMGNFLFDKMYRQLENTMQEISNHQSFQAIF